MAYFLPLVGGKKLSQVMRIAIPAASIPQLEHPIANQTLPQGFWFRAILGHIDTALSAVLIFGLVKATLWTVHLHKIPL